MKLGADTDFQLPDLSATWEGVAATPRPDEQLSAVYLDSHDLRRATHSTVAHGAGNSDVSMSPMRETRNPTINEGSMRRQPITRVRTPAGRLRAFLSAGQLPRTRGGSRASPTSTISFRGVIVL